VILRLKQPVGTDADRTFFLALERLAEKVRLRGHDGLQKRGLDMLSFAGLLPVVQSGEDAGGGEGGGLVIGEGDRADGDLAAEAEVAAGGAAHRLQHRIVGRTQPQWTPRAESGR